MKNRKNFILRSIKENGFYHLLDFSWRLNNLPSNCISPDLRYCSHTNAFKINSWYGFISRIGKTKEGKTILLFWSDITKCFRLKGEDGHFDKSIDFAQCAIKDGVVKDYLSTVYGKAPKSDVTYAFRFANGFIICGIPLAFIMMSWIFGMFYGLSIILLIMIIWLFKLKKMLNEKVFQ